MSVREVKERMANQNKISWSFVEKNLKDWRLDMLQDQLKGVTMVEEDGETMIPCRDLRKALKNPGEVV